MQNFFNPEAAGVTRIKASKVLYIVTQHLLHTNLDLTIALTLFFPSFFSLETDGRRLYRTEYNRNAAPDIMCAKAAMRYNTGKSEAEARVRRETEVTDR